MKIESQRGQQHETFSNSLYLVVSLVSALYLSLGHKNLSLVHHYLIALFGSNHYKAIKLL